MPLKHPWNNVICTKTRWKHCHTMTLCNKLETSNIFKSFWITGCNFFKDLPSLCCACPANPFSSVSLLPPAHSCLTCMGCHAKVHHFTTNIPKARLNHKSLLKYSLQVAHGKHIFFSILDPSFFHSLYSMKNVMNTLCTAHIFLNVRCNTNWRNPAVWFYINHVCLKFVIFLGATFTIFHERETEYHMEGWWGGDYESFQSLLWCEVE